MQICDICTSVGIFSTVGTDFIASTGAQEGKHDNI